MRESYPNCLIYYDNNETSSKVINSLRYSTHCEYIFMAGKSKIEMPSSSHFHLFNKNYHNKELSNQKIFYIDCRKNSFRFGTEKYSEPLAIEKYSKIDLFDECISIFQNEIIDLIQKNMVVSTGEFIFLFDFNGICNSISGFIELKGRKRIIFTSEQLSKNLDGFCNAMSKNNLSNCLFTISFKKSTKNHFLYAYHLSQYRKSFEYFRAIGINIPLIAIQNLLMRKISTYPFITSDLINFNEDNEPKYNFGASKFIFDLDETLLIRSHPVSNVLKFIHKLKTQGKRLVLLTRHTQNIIKTLKSIRLHPDIFDEIIKVERYQKKSSFIENNSKTIFIDNEFLERFDVWSKCSIPVLNLDQLEFMNC